MNNQSIFRSRFRRDWRWFPAFAFLYLLLCALFGDLPIYGGTFGKDPDDSLRALQVRNFIETGDWYNTRELRLDPPHGTEAFSRLVDLPLAAIAAPLSHYMALNDAVAVAGFIVPLFILLPLLLVAGWWAYTPLLGRDWAWLSAPFFIASISIVYEFLPGRIDHHGWQVILILLILGLTLRILQSDKVKWQAGLLFGLLVTTSLAVGIEVLPYSFVLLACVGVKLWLRPQAVDRAALALGISLPIFMAAYMALLRAPDRWHDYSLLAPNFIMVEIMAAVGLVFLIGGMMARHIPNIYSRGVVLAALAGAAGFLLLRNQPELITKNAFLGFDQWFVDYVRTQITEQLPLIKNPILWQGVCLSSLFAYIGYGFAWRRSAVNKLILAIMVLLMTAALAGCLFYAARLMRLWSLLAIPGAILCIRHGMIWLGEKLQGRQLFAAEALLIILALPFASGWINLIIDDRKISMLVTYPVSITESARMCKLDIVTDFLNIAYPQPQKILSGNIIGPQLALATRHTIVGGGIYNNSQGVLAAKTFFETADAQQAVSIINENKIDLIYICDIQDMKSDSELVAVDNAKLAPNRMMARIRKNNAPVWLEKVDIPFERRGELYRIVRDKLPAANVQK